MIKDYLTKKKRDDLSIITFFVENGVIKICIPQKASFRVAADKVKPCFG